MKKCIVILFALISTGLSYGQIVSTSAGGNWSAPATWVGGVVPTANTDVIIKGTVLHSNKKDACRNLTINVGAVLTTLSPQMNGWPLNIHGNLVNKGTIKNNDAGNWLQIAIYRDFVNDGKCVNYGIVFKGESDQTISGTKPVGPYYINMQKENSLIAGSDLVFQGVTLLFYKKNKFVVEPGKTVTLSYSGTHKRIDFYMPKDNLALDVHFTGGGKVIVKGKYDVSQAVFEGVKLVKE